MAKRRYNIYSPVKFGGEQYHPDDKEMNTIELSVKDATSLLAVNAIGDPSESEEAPTSDNTNVVKLKKAPEDLVDRVAAIKVEIGKLDKDDKTKWTAGDMPDCNVLTEMLGWKVKAEERNHAWVQFNKEEGKG